MEFTKSFKTNKKGQQIELCRRRKRWRRRRRKKRNKIKLCDSFRAPATGSQTPSSYFSPSPSATSLLAVWYRRLRSWLLYCINTSTLLYAPVQKIDLHTRTTVPPPLVPPSTSHQLSLTHTPTHTHTLTHTLSFRLEIGRFSRRLFNMIVFFSFLSSSNRGVHVTLGSYFAPL